MADAGSPRPNERVSALSSSQIEQGPDQLRIDLDEDGTADLIVSRPDFSVLSVRSTMVLRLEYRNASSISLVLQHDRNDARTWSGEEPFQIIGRIGTAMPETRLLLKASYWFML